MPKKSNSKIFDEVLNVYGKSCSCCDEKVKEFLSVDHVEGGGTSHRRTINGGGGGRHLYLWLKRNNWPSGFRILCRNCNYAIYINKNHKCPKV